MDQAPVVLAVDRDPGILALISALLEDAGYLPLAASNASDAIDFIHKRVVDLVLLERILPDMEGTELCHVIKEYYNDTFVPVIMLTGRGQLVDRVKGLDAGVDDYLIKPFHAEELMARVRALMRIRAAEVKRSNVLRALARQHGELQEAYNRLRATQAQLLETYKLTALGEDAEMRAVELHFDFPEAVKVPCQQYLLYFVEFLRDIGIDATAELREDAGKVLFSVTPKDKDEALDNIREALGIYLQLPIKQVVVPLASPETSIEVQRLGSQILHLQSQIMLGNAVLQQKELALQQKDTIIQQQQTVIQQQLLTGQVLVQSLQRETEDSDAEPVVGDIIRVKRWNPENLPVDFDLPEIIRRLKEKFSRKKLP